MQFNSNIINRFWSKVNKTQDCWEWTAYKDADGYGVYSVYQNNKITALKTHRLSYSLINGPIPKGMYICHSCDNPSCVRPDHLFLGTPDDNVKDKVNKNRQAQGEICAKSKLTEQQVLEIRLIHSTTNCTYISLAKKYNVSDNSIINIIKRQSWKHI